jgi:hypothetical protein
MSLSEMLTDLRLEARISSDVAHGSHLQQRYVQLLRRIQEEVYLAYEWKNLDVTQDATVLAGQRYTEYPAHIAFEGIRRVFQKNTSGDWKPLAYGIGADQLNAVDSEADVRQENPLRWQNYLSLQAEQINTNMFEIWPLPSRSVAVRFEGRRKLLPLVNPATDSSTVDGPMVVLHAAGELLAGGKGEDAQLKIEKARQRFDLLKRNMATASNRVVVPNSGGRVQR